MTKRYSSLDKNFDRNFDRFAKGAIIAWVLWALFCVAVVIGIVVVALHFVAKYW